MTSDADVSDDVASMTSDSRGNISNKPLLLMAIPLLIEMVMTFMIPMVDIFYLSRVSDLSVAAVSSVLPVLLIGISVMGAFQVAGLTLCSRFSGAGEELRLQQFRSLYLFLMIALAILLGLVYGFIGPWVTSLQGLEGVLQREGVAYITIWGGGMGLLVLYVCFASMLIAEGKATFVMIAGIIMNISNVILDYLLIEGHWGIPRLGVQGAAYAGVLSWALADLLLLFMATRLAQLKFAKLKTRELIWRKCREFFRLSIPSIIEPVSYQLVQLFIISLIVGLGDLELSARAYLMNFFYLTYIWNMAFSYALQTKVGHCLGEGNLTLADLFVNQALRYGFIGTSIISLSLALLSAWIVPIYTTDTELIKLIQLLLWVNVLVDIGRSINLISSSALKVSGDVIFVAFNAVMCMWILFAGLSSTLVIYLGMSILAIWCASALDELVRGFVNVMRWKSMRWKNKNAVIADSVVEAC